MSFIMTAIGEKLNVSYCGSILNTLYITFKGISFASAVMTCSNSEAMETIRYYYDADTLGNIFNGFTTITDAVLEDEDTVRITLKKSEAI